ncbi:MAG: DUF1552 domain-containing protein [Planctomycetes bacterium]|nr:DUF1552 domain-containing protein [Planctomycetota bacterium]
MHTPISRRTALKASGIAITLPLLESMNPAIGREVATPPKRMVLICNTLGLYSPSLFPKTTSDESDRTEYLDLLKEHRDDFTLFSGLSHPDQNGKEPHDTEMTWLSAARNPGLGGFKNSISLDQFAASKLGHITRFPSIALSSKSQESQSYTSNGVMLPAYDRPSTVFAKLFLDGSPQELRRQRQRLADGRSILDAVAEQTRSLNRQTSSHDRRQLDEYLAAIRAAEKEVAETEAWLDRPKPRVDEKPPQDIADSADLIGRIRALMNLIPLILQTDSTRIVTVVIPSDHSVPKIQGVTAEHHNLSHHGRDPQKIEQLKTIETEILKCFDGFLTRMAQPREVGGRLLDQTSVLFGSNLGNANSHDPSNLPIILAGGGYKHGQYIANDRSSNTPLCNLFVNLLNNMRIETESFATSTGKLTW